ncbi:trypsin-like peptidase domain-containing protein [Muricauda sp. SCSIO 64092]|uniref:S1C family serine protease n=1 Tax=Allomuricauda sp. SCSIO 64092 TaxID=2908842 RepID=UPI001FF67129|nr:trypsin-like peptidase domain-containing protein [Muricauda sp. SCSIO 64092]UOY06955.1 trypsin-like peptidase domain-containing protein [Muricauda sp. SCSIO 64092]
MKRTAQLFLVALLAGGITLGAYKYFFETKTLTLVSQNEETPFITTNLPTSPRGAGINEVDFTIAAEKTVNAVVHVKNMTVSRGNPIAEFFYGSEATQRPQIGTGSGVIISPDGYIVTNNHVIDKARALEVTLNNNKSYDAEIIGADPSSDIALLKINVEKPLPYLAFGDSDNAKIGEWVLAVGNPFNLTSTVTAGIVSAKARSISPGRNQSFIQTDAAVNPGNSGGALVNTNGDLIGINTAITSQTGSYVGYSFAVPSNIAKKVVDDLLEYGKVQKGILGISALNVDSPQAKEEGLDEIAGVYVAGIEEDSGAETAGIKEGDIIKKVGNVKVTKFSELTGYLSSKRPGDKVQVTIDRNGKKMTFPVVLKKKQTERLPVMGIEVKNLSEEDQKTYGIKSGVKITSVPEQYSDYGLLNKVMIEVDDKEIEDVEDAKNLFGKISRYGRTSITLLDENGEKERLIFQ